MIVQTIAVYFFVGVCGACGLEGLLHATRSWSFSLKNDATSLSLSNPMNHNSFENFVKILLKFVWRFLLDILVILIGIQLSEIGRLADPEENTVRALWLPLTFLLYIYIGIMQIGNARNNISQYVLGTPVLRFMGYCSFPIYLFQGIILELYYSSITGHRHDYPSNWSFVQQPLWGRFIAVMILFLYSWLIQKYVIESCVVYLYQLILKYYSTCTVCSCTSAQRYLIISDDCVQSC